MIQSTWYIYMKKKLTSFKIIETIEDDNDLLKESQACWSSPAL